MTSTLSSLYASKKAPPLELEYFLDLQTSRGDRVRDMQFREGHYLVYKIPMEDNPFIALPESFKVKAVRNIVSIRGFVILASSPWRPKKAKRYWEWDRDQEMDMPKYKTITVPMLKEPEAKPGECVLYNSYNIARIEVGLDEPLVVIRECDMVASWKPSYDKQVSLGEHTMSQQAYTHFPGIDGASAV
jgi:hypothetical protein